MLTRAPFSRGWRGRRVPVARRAAVVIVIWSVAAGLVLAVAHETKIGRTVLNLWGGHGVHLGDLAALTVIVLAALLGTVRALRHGRG